VHGPIDLDGDLGGDAVEVENVGAYRMLTTEFETGKLGALETAP
jgi:hypothetical protein